MNSFGEPDSRIMTREEEIIQVARNLFEEKGISKTTIKDITVGVGVTRTLFYHYFPDKDAVVSAVLEDYVNDFVDVLRFWNVDRKDCNARDALMSVVRLLRMIIFEKGDFRNSLVSRENAGLYIEFVNRAADHAARYLVETTAADFSRYHEVPIDHLYQTFYVLITGLVGFLRQYPEADDALIASIIAQTLHIEDCL